MVDTELQLTEDACAPSAVEALAERIREGDLDRLTSVSAYDAGTHRESSSVSRGTVTRAKLHRTLSQKSAELTQMPE